MGKVQGQELTDLQRAFVAHYLVTLNAKKSALKAGYSPQTAEEQGYQLLRNPSVRRELRKAMARRARRLELSADNVLREIARLAFSDVRSVLSFSAERVEFKASDALHSDAAAAIQSVQSDTRTRRYKDGDAETTVTLKVKLHDKMRALELAGRHLGLWGLPEDPDGDAQPAAAGDDAWRVEVLGADQGVTTSELQQQLTGYYDRRATPPPAPAAPLVVVPAADQGSGEGD